LSSLFYRGSIEVMDDRSWIYRDSPQGLQMMNYCNGVQGFINFAISILRNFSRGDIRCPCRKCKNKKYLHLDIVMMHLLHKGFMEDYLCWYAYGELFVRNESMVERMVGSTFSASNVHGVVNDNNNSYMNIVMDAMRMNQGNASQCPIVEEEPNADATMFFDLLRDSDEPL
jgi:ferredoxin-thioredoxin reductase catalytic subunit